MNSQSTPATVIEREKRIVQKLAGLPDETSIVFNDKGWDSRVYSVGGGTFFVKFPRSEKIRGRYAQEIDALKLAATSGKVAVPKVVWQHPRNDYFGYEGVRGEQLSTIVASLDDKIKQSIGATLGEFLRDFHQKKLPGARTADAAKEIAQLQDWYAPSASLIKQTFSEGERQTLERLVHEAWPKRFAGFSGKLVLCHNDLGFANILLTEGNRVGVIDFGDVAYGDESKDFIGFTDTTIFEAALKAYGDGEGLRGKIALRLDVRQIIILTAAIGKHDEPTVKQTLASLREIIARS
ncbi:MAG TPA: aminoglycoside phosphotransferase family protein [Candidatus Saccharimonadales bacterium]